LGPLGVVEVLDWAADGLNRVVRDEFFRRFSQEHAVQYFYEPFLQAFDPELRRELGVWYTPPEVVKYMVERVDQTLRSELNIADGLADPRVLVLDPCCGTGAYLVEVLRRIATTLSDGGEDAMLGMSLLEAAVSRVYGFEILPAPFVVAHLQIGLLLRRFGVQPSADHNMAGGVGNRRVGVFLTNSLTGWFPPAEEQKALAFPELQAEHNAAEHVKRDERILVVIGNPPYNGYPGLAMQEERDLVEAYRTTQRAPRPQGQGLNDLYVRFFRMAERRIVEMTGQGIICLISNYSWLDGLSHTGMRERYMEAFDRIWIDSLNGDKYRTGKLTPDGEPDPSVFSTEWNREGIQVGTAVSLLVRADPHSGTRTVQFRNFWGRTKRVDLLEAVTTSHHTEYEEVTPVLALGLPFIPGRVEQTYFGWPRVPDVFPVSYSGVQTRRDELVIDTLREELVERLKRYFDPAVSHSEMRQLCPRAMTKTAQFDPEPTRDYLRGRGPLYDYVVRYLYRPFDVRWVYWEPQTGLLGRKVPEYFAEVFPGNRFLFTTGRTRKPEVEPPVPTTTLTDLNFMDSGARGTPLFLSGGLFDSEGDRKPHPNLSAGAARYLGAVGSTPEQLFDHAVAMLHSPAYQGENAAALRQDWPRVPLPAEAPRLLAAAALGRQLAALLDQERQAAGVTTGSIRPELRVIASPMHVDGGQLSPPDFALTAGWGRGGTGGATMPGRGRAAERAYTDEERAALSTGAAALEMSEHQMLALLGETCFDVYLNDHAFWRCVPVRVWEYTLGGYQVIKKWLSYREEPLLGRPLRLDEVREVTRIARRISSILLLEPALDDAYAGVKAAPYAWK
jgi:predicted helicase